MAFYVIIQSCTPELLRKCLDENRHHFGEHVEIVVVVSGADPDNNRDTAALAEQYGCHVLGPWPSWNFSHNINVAVEWIKHHGGKPAHWVLVLNDDVSIEKLWRPSSTTSPAIGVIGALVKTRGQKTYTAGVRLDPKGNPVYRGYGEDPEKFTAPAFVEAVTAAAMWVQVGTLDVVPLNAEYRVELQDAEWCYEVRRIGLRIAFDPRFIVQHSGGVTRRRFGWLQAMCKEDRKRFKEYVENRGGRPALKLPGDAKEMSALIV